MPAVHALREAITAKAEAWKGIVKIGRIHMQDATPLTLGQEWSGYAGMLADNLVVEGTRPNLKNINEDVERSLMLVTALAPVIGYDQASKIAHHAMDHDLTLKAAALSLGFVTEEEFDRVVDPAKMVKPYVATGEGLTRG
jgi:fumarate hydratase class II